jgi:PiT family inorganic phosphate transporter
MGAFITIIILSGLMSFSIGANDAANALATSYGSKAAKLWLLLALGATFEFVGAVFCSGRVAGGLAYKMLPGLNEMPSHTVEMMMLAVCIASFSFILISSLFGMPISGTHTVIGGLVGAGMAGMTAAAVNWNKFGMTVLSWFVSPILASTLAALLFIVICAFTLGGMGGTNE